MSDFEGKVVVITGASAGIGAALALELARRGASTVLAARRREKLLDVAAGLDRPAEVVPADVTVRADVERIRDAALARFGRLDVWVNDAGRGITRASFEELTAADLQTMMRDNLESALHGMQVVLPVFKQQGNGTIVNVSSMLGRIPFASMRAGYSAAKAALNTLTDSLRIELGQQHPGIHVMLAIPGVVHTDFGLNALGGGPDSRALPGGQSAEEVARAIADGIRDRRAEVYTLPAGLERTLDRLRTLGGKNPSG